MSQLFDPTVKTLVETSPADWLRVTNRPRAKVQVIDGDVSSVRGAVDKVLRVLATPQYLLHLDFQSGHDGARVPRRLHLYNTLLDDRHDLLVLSVAVLLRPEADSRVLTGEYTRQFPGEEPHVVLRYQVLRVWELPPELFLTGGIGLLPLAPVSAVAKAELPGVIRHMKARLKERQARARAADLWAATYVLLGLRYSPEVPDLLLRGVVSMKESATYQAILAEGRAEGKAEGRAEGAVQEARNFLLCVGRKHLGQPTVQVLAAVNALADTAQLEQIGERVLEARSWEELLPALVPPRRPRRRRPGP